MAKPAIKNGSTSSQGIAAEFIRKVGNSKMK
jgi:hypothetical protein